MDKVFFFVGSALCFLLFVSLVTVSLVTASQYRVSVVDGSISILKLI